jgi:hypothetical protein
MCVGLWDGHNNTRWRRNTLCDNVQDYKHNRSEKSSFISNQHSELSHADNTLTAPPETFRTILMRKRVLSNQL